MGQIRYRRRDAPVKSIIRKVQHREITPNGIIQRQRALEMVVLEMKAGEIPELEKIRRKGTIETVGSEAQDLQSR